MSAAPVICPKCSVQNVQSSQFCGGCGSPIASAPHPNVPHPAANPSQSAFAPAPVAGPKDWHQMAGLICGVLSMFLCGVLAAAPGLYFSWSARGIAKQQGRGTGLATTGLVLNGLGIVVTVVSIIFMILAFAVAASSGQPDPMMEFNNMQGPYGY